MTASEGAAIARIVLESLARAAAGFAPRNVAPEKAWQEAAQNLFLGAEDLARFAELKKK